MWLLNIVLLGHYVWTGINANVLDANLFNVEQNNIAALHVSDFFQEERAASSYGSTTTINVSCVPDAYPNLSIPGFCAGVYDLKRLCSNLEISASTKTCQAFQGYFCCYTSIAQGNTNGNGNTQVTTTTAAPATTQQVAGAPTVTAVDTTRSAVQQQIVDIHNNLRRTVGAANMLKVQWDSTAASGAQSWAAGCSGQHGPASRNSSNFAGCGQNIAVGFNSWNDTINGWFSEKVNFTYGQSPCPSNVGHYTQILWYNSFQIGCGFAQCSIGSFFVCNYCPAGNNEATLCTPYLTGTTANGGVCGKCGGQSSSQCDNKLCTNPCLFKNDFSNCDTADPANPDFGALFADTKDCTNPDLADFVSDCQATCNCRDKGLIY